MKDRLLNFLLAFFVFLLVFNLFLPAPEKIVRETGMVNIQASEKELTIPAIPVISVFNGTSAPLQIDTCKNIEILKDYQKIEIDAPFSGFCKTLEFSSGTGKNLDLSVLSPIFENPGKYAFKLAFSGSQSVAEIEMTERGGIRSFFTELFYRPILNLFVFLIAAIPGHSLGWAIIAITILIRIALLVPQHHVLVSSRKMQAIQPKVKEIQKKYEGDQAKVWMELIELYKREGVNPLGSCLPLAIQMPILIVLYWVVDGIADPTNRFFLYSSLSSFDPTLISTVFMGVDLKAVGGIAGGILALSVAAFQWLQIKLSLKRNPVTAAIKNLEKRTDGKLVADAEATALDPEFMNAFMLWGMPAIIAISTYFFPAGVGLYWLIGTIFMLIQQPIANRIADRKAP